MLSGEISESLSVGIVALSSKLSSLAQPLLERLSRTDCSGRSDRS